MPDRINGDPEFGVGKHLNADSKTKWEVIADDVVQFKAGAM